MTITIYILRDPKGKLIKESADLDLNECWYWGEEFSRDFPSARGKSAKGQRAHARRLGYRIERFKLEVQ